MSCKTKPMVIGIVGIVLMSLAAGTALAGQQGQKACPMSCPAGQMTAKPTSQEAAQANPAVGSNLQKADRLIGMEVINPQGERLGTIEDLVLDEHDMSINYGVLSYGGLFGLGNKLFPVPWSDFRMQPLNKALVLDVRSEYLKAAPGINRSHWPSMADRDWAHQVKMSYEQGRHSTGAAREQGMEQATEPQRPMTAAVTIPFGYRRLSELIRLPARNYQGRELGVLEDVVVDMQSGPNNGKIAYGVLAVWTGFLDLKKDLSVVPWTAVEVLPEVHAIRLDTSKQALKAVAFDESHFPDLQNPQYAQSIHERFGAKPYWEALGYTPSEERARPATMSPEKTAISEVGDVSAWRPDSSYNRRFDPALVTTVTGTIEQVGTFRPSMNAVAGVSLEIKTSDGRTVTVQTGPRSYMDRQDLVLNYGDTLTATGVPATIGLDRVFIASRIQRGEQSLILRDASGRPSWNVDKLVTQRPMPPKQEEDITQQRPMDW